MFTHTVRNKEFRVFRPSIAAFRKAYFVFAQRLAVRCCSILQMRSAITNVTIEDDESGPAFRLREDCQCVLYEINVVGIADSQNIPTVAEESRSDVFGKSDARVPLDTDVIVVVDPAEIVQLQVPS